MPGPQDCLISRRACGHSVTRCRTLITLVVALVFCHDVQYPGAAIEFVAYCLVKFRGNDQYNKEHMTARRRMEVPQHTHAQGFGLAALRSIGALMLREMSTRYGRSPGGYIWALLQPLGIIVLLAFAFSLLQRAPALGTSFILFKATGMLILQIFLNLGNSVGQSLSYSKALLFYPRVSWVDAVIARFLLNTLVAVCVMVIILGGIMLFEGIRTVLDWYKIVLSTVMVSLFGFGIGCINCYLFMRFPVWLNLWGIITAPLFLISGVIFLYEDLPPIAKDILWYNPLVHLTGLMRDGFYPIYTPTYISLAYVTGWIMIPMVTGLLLLRQFNRDLINR